MSIADLINGQKPEGVEEIVAAAMLSAARPFYFAGLQIHKTLYQKGWKKIHRLPCRVICMGNLTLGGSGKTPATIMASQMLRDFGARVAILSRGYKRAKKTKEPVIVSDENRLLASPAESGDEPFLLARSLPGTPVIVCANRYQGGMEAIKRFKPDIIILDDGFQHWRLARDCDIVCIDSCQPLKNLKLFPRGALRETPAALARAHAALFTRVDEPQKIAEQVQYIRSFNRTLPVFYLRYNLNECIPLSKGAAPLSAQDLETKQVFLFCGIARPESFFRLAAQHARRIAGTLALPDHVHYDKDCLRELSHAFSRTNADYLLTTEKDAVKLESAGLPRIPVYYFRLNTQLLCENASGEFLKILLEA